MVLNTLKLLADRIVCEAIEIHAADSSKTLAEHAILFARLSNDMTIGGLGLFADSACKRGCWYCCTIPVEVRQAEADLIAKKLKGMPKDIYNETVSRSMENAKHEGDDVDGYIKQKLPCAFLNKKAMCCRIYDDRPLNCRNYDSRNRDMCKLAVGNPDQGVERSGQIIQHNFAVSLALEDALERLGADPIQTPLHKTVLSRL